MTCMFSTCLNPDGYILFALFEERERLLIEEVGGLRGSGSTKKVKYVSPVNH